MNDLQVAFGPFVLLGRQRLLCHNDRPLRLGGRALDILQVLIEHAGAVVSPEVLMIRVWPSSVVEASTLRVHIAALRRVLGQGQDGQRYIVHVPSQGYRFAATLRPVPRVPRLHNLPRRLTPVIGREALTARVMAHVSGQRCVTLVGPAGIGKTTLALGAAQSLLGHYANGVWLVDLATLSDPSHLPVLVANTLGLEAGLDELSGWQALLVFDSCEPVLDACRRLVDRLLAAAPQLTILVTSREPLGAHQETLLPVPSLSVPALWDMHSVDQVLGCSAVQMLVRCARARQQGFNVREQDVPTVHDICQRLDGLPLAIELAAANIDSLGLVGLQAQLGRGFLRLAQGRRTAVVRHQSLYAALDWSYGRLSKVEQTVLQRLAVFKKGFSLDAALLVISDEGLPAPLALGAISRLLATSLLTLEASGEVTRYRVLHTTRAYALHKLECSGELWTLEQRYRRYMSRVRGLSVAALEPVEQMPDVG